MGLIGIHYNAGRENERERENQREPDAKRKQGTVIPEGRVCYE